jgi:hypothetical protein
MWQKNNIVAVGSDVAERLDIATRQSESCTLKITLYDPTTGQPFDLTGFSFVLSFSANGTSEVLSATTGSGLTIGAGVITVNLLPAQMNFSAGQYVYRLTATSASVTKTWLQGLVNHVAQWQLQPASEVLKNSGQTYVRIGEKDILVSITNNI